MIQVKDLISVGSEASTVFNTSMLDILGVLR